ncbi:MAG: glycosyltransferase [Lachnospiraceae bacterium]|nr:glycosyltransferase [Lachnospiraceae bacterium]
MISVLTAVYNAEAYIVRCIKSVLKQSFTDIEFIILDDGSDDESPELIMAYGSTDPRVRIYREEHRGIAACRKELISYSQGDALIFLDADDYMETDMLKKMADSMAEYTADAVICGYTMEYSDKSIKGRIRLKSGYHKPDEWEEIKNKSLLYDRESGNTDNAPTVWNLLAKRELYAEAALCLDDRLARGEDTILSYGTLLRAKTVVVSDEPLYHYTQRNDSLMRQGFFNFPENRQLFEEGLKAAVEAAGYPMLKDQAEEIRRKLDNIVLIQRKRERGNIDAAGYTDMLKMLLSAGERVRLKPTGISMLPLIRPDTDTVWIEKREKTEKGDILLCEDGNGAVLHRLIGKTRKNGREYYILKGDNSKEKDTPVDRAMVLGTVVKIEREGELKDIRDAEGRAYHMLKSRFTVLDGIITGIRRAALFKKGYRYCNCCGNFAPFRIYEDRDWDQEKRKKYYTTKEKISCCYCGSVPYMRLAVNAAEKEEGFTGNEILSYSMHPPIESWLKRKLIPYYVLGPVAYREPEGEGLCDEDPELQPPEGKRFKSILCVHGLEFASEPLKALDELISKASEDATIIMAFSKSSEQSELADRSFKAYVFGAAMEEKIDSRLREAGFIKKEAGIDKNSKELMLMNGPAIFDECRMSIYVRT